jgi:SAM-dependent methyltransferase
MKLSPRDVERLEDFLERVKNETYPEPPSPLHSQITEKMLNQVLELAKLPPQAKVLDVGCGQGVALERFVKAGLTPIGITVNQVDLEACRQRGFDVRDMDQSFLDFENGTFDLIWCRHCIEHSIFPFFTLSQLTRVLKDDGWLYIEVPAPDTTAQHQTNKNHYSVLGRSAWMDLIGRVGVGPVYSLDISMTVGTGPDMYFAFLGKKGGAARDIARD